MFRAPPPKFGGACLDAFPFFDVFFFPMVGAEPKRLAIRGKGVLGPGPPSKY